VSDQDSGVLLVSADAQHLVLDIGRDGDSLHSWECLSPFLDSPATLLRESGKTIIASYGPHRRWESGILGLTSLSPEDPPSICPHIARIQPISVNLQPVLPTSNFQNVSPEIWNLQELSLSPTVVQ
jgi:hypothetical protein